jgi:hypothetical protein
MISICLLVLMTSFFSCAGTLLEMDADDETQRLSEEAFMLEVKEKVDYQVRHEDAMRNMDAVRGKIVKWHGTITEIWEDNIKISGRMVLNRPRDGSPVPSYVDRNNPSNYSFYENFLFSLDHPLPREKRIGDMTPSLAPWDAIYVIGRIMGTETIITESGVNITLPVLRGYAVAKENDRSFQYPVWISHGM